MPECFVASVAVDQKNRRTADEADEEEEQEDEAADEEGTGLRGGHHADETD